MVFQLWFLAQWWEDCDQIYRFNSICCVWLFWFNWPLELMSYGCRETQWESWDHDYGGNKISVFEVWSCNEKINRRKFGLLEDELSEEDNLECQRQQSSEGAPRCKIFLWMELFFFLLVSLSNHMSNFCVLVSDLHSHSLGCLLISSTFFNRISQLKDVKKH